MPFNFIAANVNKILALTLDLRHRFGDGQLTENYIFRIDYFDAQGNLRNSELRETPQDHWDLCVQVFDNLPTGIENFHLTELTESDDAGCRPYPIVQLPVIQNDPFQHREY